MADAQEMLDQLSAPFAPECIEWRVGSTNADKTKASALAYIDARTVMDRLDSVCGPDGWQREHTSLATGIAICRLKLKMPNGEWLTKEDGAGATDIEGEKGMLSDSFKRAAVSWGVGRYLYAMETPWVEIEPAGRSFRIKKSELKVLEDIHEKEARKVGWGGPTDGAAYKLLVHVVQDTVTQPSDAEAFKAKHKGMIPQLRVAMRGHLIGLLDNIGSHKQAAE